LFAIRGPGDELGVLKIETSWNDCATTFKSSSVVAIRSHDDGSFVEGALRASTGFKSQVELPGCRGKAVGLLSMNMTVERYDRTVFEMFRGPRVGKSRETCICRIYAESIHLGLCAHFAICLSRGYTGIFFIRPEWYCRSGVL
jgi:hypothetical protein